MHVQHKGNVNVIRNVELWGHFTDIHLTLIHAIQR